MYMSRPPGFWYSYEKDWYNPDGSMKERRKEALLARGKTIDEIARDESFMMREVAAYNKQVKFVEKKYNKPYEKWCREASGNSSPAETEARTRKAIAEGEDISSLPGDVDPDEYYSF